MKLEVKKTKKQTKEVEIDEQETIGQLKMKVAEAFGTQISDFKLVYHTKTLSDNDAIVSSVFRDGDTISYVSYNSASQTSSPSSASQDTLSSEAAVSPSPADLSAQVDELLDRYQYMNEEEPLEAYINEVLMLGGVSTSAKEITDDDVLQLYGFPRTEKIEALLKDEKVIKGLKAIKLGFKLLGGMDGIKRDYLFGRKPTPPQYVYENSPYAEQLMIMQETGLTDIELCKRALEYSNGDIEKALDWIAENQND